MNSRFLGGYDTNEPNIEGPFDVPLNMNCPKLTRMNKFLVLDALGELHELHQ